MIMACEPNREKEGQEPVVLMFFMRSFARQQENNFLSLGSHVEAGLNERVKVFWEIELQCLWVVCRVK